MIFLLSKRFLSTFNHHKTILKSQFELPELILQGQKQPTQCCYIDNEDGKGGKKRKDD